MRVIIPSSSMERRLAVGERLLADPRQIPLEFQIPEAAEEGVIYGGCNCGNCHLTILPTGNIYACRRVQDSRVGNVFTDRLADVWVCQMEAYRDYSKFEKCAKCRLLAFCRGCPAVASGKDGNFYAADALGIGSCYIGQGWTAFADPYGQEVLRRWGVGADYYAVMQLLLGYPREKDRHPAPKPRREGRVLRF